MGLSSHVGTRVDRLLGTVILGVLVGKFTGDLATLYLIAEFGRPAGIVIGLVVSVLAYLVWPSLERRLQSGDRENE